MLYTIGICDDKDSVCTFVEQMVLKYARENGLHFQTVIYNAGERLCDYLEQGNPLDVLFLDIELFQMSGIEVGDFIRNRLENRKVQIVYISVEANYAWKLFKTQPLDFLVKPIEEKEVNEVLALAVKILQKDSLQFEYHLGKEYHRLPYSEIMGFFSEGRKIKILTEKGTREYYGKLKDIIPQLPNNFLAIHQSYAGNSHFIVKYTYEQVELWDGTILTISKPNRKRIRQQILRRMDV